jgi:hypothetical protein
VLSVLAVAGIGLYFVLRSKPKNSNPELDLDANDLSPLPSSPTASNEVDQPNNVLEFQEWVILVKKDKTILGSGGASGFGDDGKFGSKTQLAWKKYKPEFLKWKYNKPQIAQPSISDSLQKDIQTIIAMATGVFATKNFLETDINKPSKQSFVRAWANALRNNRANPSKGTVFVYRAGNQNILHESFTGKRLLGFNPIDRSPMPLTTARWYNNPKVSAWSYVGASAKPIGKINGLQTAQREIAELHQRLKADDELYDN